MRDGAPGAVPGAGYLRHWGLAEAPFLLEPDRRFAYERADHREGLARILFGITQLGGIVVITGEIGAGKTLLSQTLRATLDGEGFRVAEVPNPPRTAAALLAAVLEAAGAPRAGGSAARIAGLLRGRLVDAEHRPGPEGPGVPVVMLGQPELSRHVERLPQVAQRVVVRYHLGPMGADEVDAYALHRTRVAGAQRRIVSKRAARAVHRETGGVPRLVNLLLANALFVAAERDEGQIGEDTIRDLAEDRRMDLAAASPDAEAGS